MGPTATSNTTTLNSAFDGLPDAPFLGLPYFEVLEIIPAVEDGYLEYDEAEGVAA